MIRTLRHWWHQPDHYYWITAILAARGAQTATCRMISALIFTLGCLPVVMVWSPAGPQGTHGTAIAVLVALCALVAAVYWNRQRWPTKKQSLVFAFVMTLCIAANTVTHANPVSGFVTGATFAAVASYLIFFHTPRYLLMMAVAAMAAVLVPIARLALKGDAVWALSLLGAAIVTTVAVTFVSQALVHLLGIATPDTDIERVTGLLNRDAFYEATGAFIASRSRLDDRYLVIIVISLDNFALLANTARADRARVSVGQALRETTRHDAVVAHVAESEFLCADSFVSEDASALVERVRSAIRSTPLRMTASIGVVITPMRELASCPPYDLLDELVALATTAMYEARRSGGNQANYVQCARPAALDDYPGRAEDAS